VDLQLNGRRAVVTGSSARIGEAIARRLAAEGAAVIVHGRRAGAVDAVVDAVRSAGGQADGVQASLSDPGECARFVCRVLADGGADILVNNTGAFVDRGWDGATPQDWLDLYAINVAAAVRCI
jgi:3-oxoacyl-[acyl-carrier protein] reductase